MLEYRINKKLLSSDKYKVKLIDNSEETGLVDYKPNTDDQIIVFDGDNDKLVMRCDCYGLDQLKYGDKINVNTKISLNYGDEYYDTVLHDFEFYNEFDVSAADETNSFFSFKINKFMTMNVTDLHLVSEMVTQENSDELVNEIGLYVNFENFHYFDKTDNLNEDIVLYFQYYDQEQECFVNVPVKFNFYTPFSLRSTVDSSFLSNANVQKVFNFVFGGTNIANDVDRREKPTTFKVLRKTFLFDSRTDYEIYHDVAMTTINVPLSQAFDLNMYQSDMLQENFVDVEKKDAINKIIDMEKDVYHPVFKDKNNEIQDLFKITFNLHFRKHRGEKWICNNDEYWNGTYLEGEGDEKQVKFIDDYFVYDIEKEQHQEQSDLLSYLNFNNNDVRYQKNRLKKSFIRLTFYDSPEPLSQNLLSYSTIFFDSNEMFVKLAKNLMKGDYYRIDETTEKVGDKEVTTYKKYDQLIGIRVDREPDLKEEEKPAKDDTYRLSCQITVTDRNNSKSSCDGFYFYTWKNDEIGTEERTVYMQVEFNHAKYGRVIPFMMPYWDKKKHNTIPSNPNRVGYIKTFKEILDDWNNPLDESKDSRYGMRQYNKFRFIKFKYKYDSEIQKHIYYLDDDVYNTTGNVIDNNLFLDLFEAKVNTDYVEAL